MMREKKVEIRDGKEYKTNRELGLRRTFFIEISASLTF